MRVASFTVVSRIFGPALLLLLLATPAPAIAASRNVLILRGESPDGGRVVMDAIQSTVRKAFTSPVEFYIETIDSRRFVGADYERRVAALLTAKFADIPLHLVVAISEPAARFVLDEHPQPLSGVPLLVGLVERRLIDPAAFPAGTGIVYVSIDPVATLRLALQVYPAAKRVLVAGGTSGFDRGWQRLVREDLQAVHTTIPIEYDTESSLDVLLRRVKGLSRDTVVVYTSMTRDGAGMPARPVEVLEALRNGAVAPIFGISSTYLGRGIVGGALLDYDRHGADLGNQAARILAGDSPAPITTPAVLAVDWRELRHFGGDARSLPAGTRVVYRSDALWNSNRKTVFAAVMIFAAQTTLILLLVRVGRRRRETQRLLEGRLRFERALAELSAALVSPPPSGIDEAVDRALNRVASRMGIDWLWRWDFGAPADARWESARLCSEESEAFSSFAELPPTLRRRLRETAGQDGSAVAVPVALGPVVTGALFWISRSKHPEPPGSLDELKMLAAVVADVLRRKHAEAALERSDRLKGAILASLPAHVAVLNREGAVIAVNDARGQSDHGDDLPEAIALVARRRWDAPTDADAGVCSGTLEAAAVIEAVCRGESAGRQLEYRCDEGPTERWFLMTAQPLRGDEKGAVVTHLEITERKVNEIALRESEGRFRRMADALPVAIWMSDADGLFYYFNRQWLQVTGRSLDEEVGSGWLDSVHPDDAIRCMHVFLEALRQRESFQMEYRIRRQDGEYRWFLDTGVPRYGSDGAFHGYVGGCVDISERKDAERLLRDLSRRLMVAQDEERRRMARELHDHLSQQLALLAIDLQLLAVHPPASPMDAVPALQNAWRRTTEIASDVHAISHRLHPSKMEALGLVATIRAHCRDVSRQNLAVRFEEQDVPTGISPDRALSLFRVVEEALSNVARHSGATQAHVVLLGLDSAVVLRIADNGTGFTDNRSLDTGLGLVSMRERVESLSGSLSIMSGAGKGTIVEARVPLAALRESPQDAAPRAVPAPRSKTSTGRPTRHAESA